MLLEYKMTSGDWFCTRWNHLKSYSTDACRWSNVVTSCNNWPDQELWGTIHSDHCSFPPSLTEHVIRPHPSLNHPLAHSDPPSLQSPDRPSVPLFLQSQNNTAPFWSHIHLTLGQDGVKYEKWLLTTISVSPCLSDLQLHFGRRKKKQKTNGGRCWELAHFWVSLTWLHFRLNHCRSVLITKTRPFHKCWKLRLWEV